MEESKRYPPSVRWASASCRASRWRRQGCGEGEGRGNEGCGEGGGGKGDGGKGGGAQGSGIGGSDQIRFSLGRLRVRAQTPLHVGHPIALVSQGG